MFAQLEAAQTTDFQEKYNWGYLIENLIFDTQELGSSQWEKDLTLVLSLYPQTFFLLGKRFVFQRSFINNEVVAEQMDAFGAEILEEAAQLEALQNGTWCPNKERFTRDIIL